MRVLLFLILGTLIFGLAFPAFILIVGFFLLLFVALALFSFLTGIFRNGNMIIYKNGRRVDTSGRRRDDKHTADDPEIITDAGRPGYDNSGDFGEEAEGEIIELPASALSKGKEETDGDKTDR